MNNVINKVGLVSCSNGFNIKYKDKIVLLKDTLTKMGIDVVLSNFIYEKESVFSGTPKERADELMGFYKDDSIDEIFDISGGDIANGILDYLDYDLIAKSNKRFWGYSDLTTIINAIYAKTSKSSVLYQIRNIIYNYKEQQIKDVYNTLCKKQNDLYKIEYKFIQQNRMCGVVIGGNIRCFLKLAGTEYMPDFTDKILLLESYSGTVAQMETYLWQLKQLGAFDKVAGILFGTFTQMEKEECVLTVVELLKRIVEEEIPIAVTKNIGHSTDSKAIIIGKEMNLMEG